MKTLKWPVFPNYTDLKVEDLEWLLSGVVESLDAFGKLVDAGNTAVRLFGCEVTITAGTPDDYSITAGAIYFNGEIYLVDAFTGSSDTDIPVFTITETNDPDDGHSLQDGSAYVVRRDRKLVVSMGAAGSGDFDYTAIRNAFDTPWINATLQNGWTTSGTDNNRLKYRRLANGNVHLQGVASHTASGASSSVFMTLPATYRSGWPVKYELCYESEAGSVQALNIQPNGSISLDSYTAGNSETLNIDIIFYAHA